MTMQFQRAVNQPMSEKDMLVTADKLGTSVEEVRKVADEVLAEEVWLSDLYQVNVRRKVGGITHLSIKRRDKKPVGRSRFRDFQEIKNALVGAETEAVELYPAESRLVDTANQYHLWCFPAGVTLPFGFNDRLISGESFGGAVQEPFK